MEFQAEDFYTFAQWWGSAIKFFVIAVPVLALLGIFVCYLISAFRKGPIEAFYSVAGVIATAIGKDLPATRLRRILAIARLTVKDAIRRRVIVAFIIFVVLFLFAGWFLDVKSDDPAHLYMSFVLTTTNYLVIVLSLFLATASLPTDIKTKTIYTIVTKPVRSSELILGRVLGFAAVVTVLLIGMGIVSYLFVDRGMRHEHQVRPDSVASIAPLEEGKASPGWEGSTTTNSHHRHTWRVTDKGLGVTDKVMGHQHVVTRTQTDGGEISYQVGTPQGALEARVPIYGKLRFLDREGNPAEKGVNVGKEWDYRSYIEGRTLAAGVWNFEGISEKEFPKHLPLALTLSVFRTYKADIETGVRGIIVINSTDPRRPLQCDPIGFESKEFATQHLRIPRKLRPKGADPKSEQEIDLFDDLVQDGKLEVWLLCDDPMQYFGIAQADLYVEAEKASFPWNFTKGYLAIWMQMLLVVCLGVMFSTFLSTPVAMLATFSAVLLGFFGYFIRDLLTGKLFGGGPIEALIRLVNQDNLVKPLEFGAGDVGVAIVKFIDNIFLAIMNAMSAILPNFAGLGRATDYVAYNLNFQNQLLARQGLTTLVYVTAIVIVGYFFLRTREIAA